MPLKEYHAEQTKKLAPTKKEPTPAGVACTELVCSPCQRKHRAKERPLGRENRRIWHDEHETTLVSCDGEMMWDEPRKKHPELKELARARCGECGWKGWV